MLYNKRFEILLWTVCVVSGTLDLFTTKKGIDMGYKEKNPIGSLLITESGFISLAVVKILIIVFCFVLSKRLLDGKWRYMPPLLITIIWSLAAFLNFSKL